MTRSKWGQCGQNVKFYPNCTTDVYLTATPATPNFNFLWSCDLTTSNHPAKNCWASDLVSSNRITLPPWDLIKNLEILCGL